MAINYGKLIEYTIENGKKLNQPKKHFTFIIKKNNILSIGINNPKKTSPIANKFGYNYPYIHSELAAILKFPLTTQQLQYCKIINTRLGLNNQIIMSRPCKFCAKLLSSYNVKEVEYTNEFGLFEKFILP